MRKPKARGNGQGSVYQVSGTAHERAPWVAVVTVGHQLDGRPIRRCRYRSSRPEALAALRDMLADRAAGRTVRDDRMTLTGYARTWLGGVEQSRRPATWRRYESIVRSWIAPIVGDRPLLALSVADVRAFVARVESAGGPRLARSCLVILRILLGAAVREELVGRNVATLVVPPETGQPQRDTLTAAEARAILAASAGSRWRALWCVALVGGLRASELCGLRWEDRDGDTLRPTFQLVRHGEGYALGPLKAGEGRIIGLPPFAIAALETWKAAQNKERLAAGRGWRGIDAEGNSLMFTFPDGRPVPRERVWREWHRACQRAGVRHLPLHAARRFVASQQTAAADLKVAQATLGHARADMTASVYAQAVEGARRAAEAMQEVLSG
jgi:integrase